VKEVNGKGNYLLVRAFLQLLPTPETKASIILLTTFQSLLPMPPLSGYFLSKSIVDNLCSYIAADYPNVTAVSLHPGLVKTDMLKEPVRSMFNTDSPELIGGVAVWLCGGGEGRSWLSGRFVSVNWDVEELEQRREEIGENDLLKMTLKGKFGKDAVALK
jgi:NAD(P)-dependent dehydrogenase (short-subunit alcohol dehydrogenase family)